MDPTKKHWILQTVAISIAVFLKNKYKSQGDTVEFVHECHTDSGRKDGSEELLFQTGKEPDHWLRVRIDVVDNVYAAAIKEAHAMQDKADEANGLNSPEIVATKIIGRILGIRLI